MQARPGRGRSPPARRQAPGGLLRAVTLLPHTVLLASTSFFDAALCIVVLRIVGPALPLQVALQPPARARIGSQFLGQEQQARRALLRDNGQRSGKGDSVATVPSPKNGTYEFPHMLAQAFLTPFTGRGFST